MPYGTTGSSCAGDAGPRPAGAASERDRAPHDRAGRAGSATPAQAQLGAPDGADLDTGLAQRGVGVGGAVVGEHHARLQGHRVVAAVPVRALGGVHVAAGLHGPQPRQSECLGDHVDEGGRGLVGELDAGRPVAGAQGGGVDGLHDRRMQGDQVAVGEGEHLSRCIAERSLGIPATMTCTAAPWSNSASGTGHGAPCVRPGGQRLIQPSARARIPRTAPATETARMTRSRSEKSRRPCSRRAITNRTVAGA